MITNGFTGISEPVLDPLETITLQDALLDHSDGTVTETVWPKADFIIGNPPFLGNQRIRSEIGSEYQRALASLYSNRVPGNADLCCYWFDRARGQIEQGHARRAGLLATQAIRVGANRQVLDRIKETGDIYMAWSDESWILEGAAVRISIVGFDDGRETERFLNGVSVAEIHPNLSAGVDLSAARILQENQNISFIGVQPAGDFDVDESLAKAWLALPINVNSRPNSDVVKQFVNAKDLVQGSRNRWIVDFGSRMIEEQAALYEAPFDHVLNHVRPARIKNRDEWSHQKWWLHQRPRPAMRSAVENLRRFLCTPRVAKHRIFVWLRIDVIPGNKVVVFARDDDYFFGVLHSRAHEVWSLALSGRHGVGNDPVYQNSATFEAFPLPWPPGTEPTDDPRVIAIGNAAARLDEFRRNWLDPEGADGAKLKKRTLTNLYNARPQWLQNAHAALDRAVWDAYGWDDLDPASVEEDTILARLLALNLERSDAAGQVAGS